jgi:hypothetical protein
MAEFAPTKQQEWERKYLQVRPTKPSYRRQHESSPRVDYRTDPPSRYDFSQLFDPDWYDYLYGQPERPLAEEAGRKFPLPVTSAPDRPLRHSEAYGHYRLADPLWNRYFTNRFHPDQRGKYNVPLGEFLAAQVTDPRIFPATGWREQFQPTERPLAERTKKAQALLDKGYHVPIPTHDTSYLDFGEGIGKLPINIGALPGSTPEEAGGPTRRATGALQAVEDYGTLPFYLFPGTALGAGAIDVTRGILNKDVLEIALSMLGVARPLASIPRAVSEAFEKTYLKATGSLGVATFLNNFAEKLFSSEAPYSSNLENIPSTNLRGELE